MTFCNDQNSIATIDINECLGNSLVTINANFTTLKDEICLQDKNINTLESEKELLSSYVSTLSSQLNTLPKCLVNFNKAATIVKSQGINNVVKSSTGIYRVFFSNSFTNTKYLTIGSTIPETNVPESACFLFVVNETTTYVDIETRDIFGSLTDPYFINLLFFS
jgi:hypothetical protein